MMDAGPALRHAGAFFALVLKQRQIDLAVAHVAIERSLAFLDCGAFEPERLLVEVGGRLDVLDAQRDVADASGHDASPCLVTRVSEIRLSESNHSRPCR